MIPFAKPLLGEEEAEAAKNAVLSGWVTQGPEVAAFEDAFAGYAGAKYACAVSNCTAGLHLALQAVGVGKDDEVITVSYSFIATANAIRFLNAVPVFVDIEPDSFNMDPSLVESAITEKTKAILCVHQLGMPCDLASISEIAFKHGLPLVEDAACAVGSQVNMDGAWEPIGRPRGAVACFSFHPRKVLTTGDGGMITTNDSEIDRKVRLWRHQGMSVPDLARAQSKEVIFDTYPEVGYNYRMTDIQAAVGRKQLDRLPDIIEARRRIGARYLKKLSAAPEIRCHVEPEHARWNWQTFNVWLPDGCDQKQVMQQMLDLGVSTRRGTLCSHLEESYADIPLRTPLPISERVYYRTIALPLYPQMTDHEQDTVVDVLLKACGLK